MYIKHDLNKLFAELDPSFQLQEEYFLNFRGAIQNVMATDSNTLNLNCKC